MTRLLAKRLAAPTAIIAMIGSVGWVGGAALSRGVLSTPLLMLVAVSALVVGAVVYMWMQRLVLQSLRPVNDVTQALKSAAGRPRDHITAVKRFLRSFDSGPRDDGSELIEALIQLLRRIEDRQMRQAAWSAALVHDVKTPVAAAANALAVVSSEVQTWSGTERDLVRRVSDELRALASNVQESLDAMRLEREDVQLDIVEIDLKILAEGAVNALHCPAAVRVSVRGQGRALGDAHLLARVIGNLVANAVRCARTSVVVEVFPGLVRITDDGPGLPDSLEALSEPFRSAGLVIGNEVLHGGAAGMGLFLARRVLELHRGRLVVERSDSSGTVMLAYIGRTREASDRA